MCASCRRFVVQRDHLSLVTVFRPSADHHRRLTRRPAAYTPDTARPICPMCWSMPDLKWGRDDVVGASMPRGWAVSQTAEPAIIDGLAVPVTMSIYRCANPQCTTAIELGVLVTAGYVPALVRQHQLAGGAAAQFRAGRLAGAGVWVDAAGEPRTAPLQRELF